MGGPVVDMFSSRSLTLARITPDDLCVDSFRNGELLISALLEVADNHLTKATLSNRSHLCGWKSGDGELYDRGIAAIRRRNGLNLQQFGCGGFIDEPKFTFQHHLDASDYIEEYRKRYTLVQEPPEQRTMALAEHPKIIVFERLKLLNESGKKAERRLTENSMQDREKETLQKSMDLVQLITPKTKSQSATFEEFSKSIQALSECYQVHRLTPTYEVGVKGYEEPRTTPVCKSPAQHFPEEETLDGLHFNCVMGKSMATTKSSTDSNSSSSSHRKNKKRHPKKNQQLEPKSIKQEEQLERRHLVLPRITQDLCASFRQETQIDDVKRLKDYKRLRQLESQDRIDDLDLSVGLKLRHDLLESVRPETFFNGTSRDHSGRGLTLGDFRDLKAQRKSADKKETPQVSPIVVPWTSLALSRRPYTRRKHQATVMPKGDS